jgi:hypothetical protein
MARGPVGSRWCSRVLAVLVLFAAAEYPAVRAQQQPPPLPPPPPPPQQFSFYPTPRTWIEAQNDCVSRGMHLATVCSASELASLVDSVERCEDSPQQGALGIDVWIGFNDRHTEGSFRWVSDSSAAAATSCAFSDWSTRYSQPNDFEFSEDCTLVQRSGRGGDGRWYDRQCMSKKAYVCSKPWAGTAEELLAWYDGQHCPPHKSDPSSSGGGGSTGSSQQGDNRGSSGQDATAVQPPDVLPTMGLLMAVIVVVFCVATISRGRQRLRLRSAQVRIDAVGGPAEAAAAATAAT